MYLNGEIIILYFGVKVYPVVFLNRVMYGRPCGRGFSAHSEKSGFWKV